MDLPRAGSARIAGEGGERRGIPSALGVFRELADAFARKPQCRRAAGVSTAANLGKADYELDIGGCLTCGWNLLKKQFRAAVVPVIYNLIEGVVAGFVHDSSLARLFSLANLVVVGR